MEDLQKQLQKRCVHFNGISNKCCKAGVNYDTFRKMEKPFKFPCLSQGGECSLSKFLTEEEAKAQVIEILGAGESALIARDLIIEQVAKSTSRAGEVPCVCGGRVRYIMASNNHIRAKCSKCELSFVE